MPDQGTTFNVAFVGATRYTQPLDPTSDKKFRALARLGSMCIIGVTQGEAPMRFEQHARFFLLPAPRQPVLRYLLFFTCAPVIALWCVLRHHSDVLVAQSPYEAVPAALAKIVARLLGRHVGLIVETHGDFERALFLQRRVHGARLYRLLMTRAARFSLAHADACRVISTATREQIAGWIGATPIVQFPAWTDLDVFEHAGRGRAPERATMIILYAGVLTRLKGIHVLVEAFARVAPEHPEARLVLVGEAVDEPYQRELCALAARLAVAERVTFLGKVRQTELAEQMAGARVVVLPSLSEGLSRVIIEAMACGRAVLASRVGGIPELVADGKTGYLVPPGDVAAFADRLGSLLAHPDQARAMGEAARERSGMFFSTEAYVRGYAELFGMARRAA